MISINSKDMLLFKDNVKEIWAIQLKRNTFSWERSTWDWIGASVKDLRRILKAVSGMSHSFAATQLRIWEVLQELREEFTSRSRTQDPKRGWSRINVKKWTIKTWKKNPSKIFSFSKKTRCSSTCKVYDFNNTKV